MRRDREEEKEARKRRQKERKGERENNLTERFVPRKVDGRARAVAVMNELRFVSLQRHILQNYFHPTNNDRRQLPERVRESVSGCGVWTPA